MPVSIAVSAAAACKRSLCSPFPILWVIFWAIALFRVTVETGQSEIIKISIGRLTPDPRLQMLLIAVAFAGFLEGAAGFGAPVAIAATMLVGLGFSAFNASAACLLANTAPVAFGSIGIPLLTLALITGLPVNKLGIATAAYLSARRDHHPALHHARHGWLACHARHMASDAGLRHRLWRRAIFGWQNSSAPQLTDNIIAALATIAALILVIRLRREPKELDLEFATQSLDGGPCIRHRR